MIRIKRNILVLTIMALLISLLGGFSPAAKSDVNGKTVYPLTITDSDGSKVTFPKLPLRVISLAPSITETVKVVSSINRLVGRTDYCDYPLSVKKTPSVGGMLEPNIEKIVSLKPDVVIASNMTKSDVISKLKQLNIKTIVLSEPQSIDGAYNTIKKVGQILNENDNADRIISGMKKKIDMIQNKVKNAKTPKVYYVVSYGKYGDYTGGKDTYIDKLITMAGGKNIASDVQGWKYSLEKIIDNDPDIIICSKYGGMKPGFVSGNGYKDLTAVKSGKVFEIDSNRIDRQGPRLADGLMELAKIIHPELFK